MIEVSGNCLYPNSLIKKSAGVIECKAAFKWVKVNGRCLHRRLDWVISFSMPSINPRVCDAALPCSLADGELSKRNPKISQSVGVMAWPQARAGSAPFGSPLSFCHQRIPVTSNELIETGRKPEACQLVWEVQLVKVQQRVICSAGTESRFIEQFCSSVILTLLAIRCVYVVSVPLHSKLACVCSPSELEEGGCWAACTEGSLSESFIV